ncbi:hypothetical protein [Silvanigrella aquatica]|uniref:Uncharacterized protein n=1 Tax=Silvanigrella aquatica TaxID=1915309 RepID=A0A1L4CX52_9BACT|nr:hypothetical protein [Silvanigrella aquatica]APJ02519.1 hypothetical protein AXG55_00645 [Silvanigrella aquatica]
MREIHLLENNEACARFVVSRAAQGFSPETFLGIGAFASHVPNIGKGIVVRSSPAFFENELSDSIVQGHFSAFEKESLLMQVTMGEIGNFPISRWFLVGQHLSIFDAPKVDVKRYLPTLDLINARSIEDFVQIYLGNLFPHIQEIRAQSVLFLFDINMFSHYLKSFFTWLSSYLRMSELTGLIINPLDSEVQKKITSEFLWYLADSALHPCIGLYPSTQICFHYLIQSARSISKYGNFSEELIFKL